MTTQARKPATVAGGDHDRLEIVGGEIAENALPTMAHSSAQFVIAQLIGPRFHRKGGWWFGTAVHVAYPSDDLYSHDAVGWLRDRVPARPTPSPVRVRPDWVCEIVSSKSKKWDHIDKPRTLHAAEVPHYWVIDPDERLLLVQRWTRDGYLTVQRATSGESVRAEPFEAIEIRVGVLFGDEDEEDPEP